VADVWATVPMWVGSISGPGWFIGSGLRRRNVFGFLYSFFMNTEVEIKSRKISRFVRKI
jgi:hypothetical protein